MTPDIRLSWGDAKPAHVPFDEVQVLPLASGRPRIIVRMTPTRRARTGGQGYGKAIVKQFDGKNETIPEVNLKAPSLRLYDAAHRLPRHLVRDVLHAATPSSQNQSPLPLMLWTEAQPGAQLRATAPPRPARSGQASIPDSTRGRLERAVARQLQRLVRRPPTRLRRRELKSEEPAGNLEPLLLRETVEAH